MSPKQSKILLFIYNFIEKNGYSPSYEVIAHGCNLSSKARVHEVVHILKDQNFLTFKKGIRNSIEITNMPKGLIKNKSEWQPIENAPKNGLIIELYGKNKLGKQRIIFARYTMKYVEEADDCDEDWLDEMNDKYYYPEGWYEVCWCNDDFHMFKVHNSCIKPTHWKHKSTYPKESE